jgi:hypothetical protein
MLHIPETQRRDTGQRNYRLTGLLKKRDITPALVSPDSSLTPRQVSLQHTFHTRMQPLTRTSTDFNPIHTAPAQMPTRSAFNSLLSRIGTKLRVRSSAIGSHGISARERARSLSFDSDDSIMSIKHTSQPRPQPRQASKVSFCSVVRNTFARGLSKVHRPWTRGKSQTNTEPVNTKHEGNVPPAYRFDPHHVHKQNPEIWEDDEAYGPYYSHNDPTLPEYSQIPPSLLPINQSEASGGGKSPSIHWHARPPDVNGTPNAEVKLIVQPSTSPWGRRTFATSVVPNELKWDSSLNRRSISHFLGQVHEEKKTTRTGPFWDRKYRNLNEAVTEVIERNERSRKGTPGGAWIGVREDTQRFSAWYVYKEDWKDVGREVKYLWDAHVKPVTKRCLSSAQSRG